MFRCWPRSSPFFSFFFSFSVNLILSDLCLIFGKLFSVQLLSDLAMLNPSSPLSARLFHVLFCFLNCQMSAYRVFPYTVSFHGPHFTPLHSIAALQTYWVLNIKSISAIQRIWMPRNSVQTTDYRKQCFKCFHKQQNRKFYYSTRRKSFLKFFSNKNSQAGVASVLFFCFLKTSRKRKCLQYIYSVITTWSTPERVYIRI